MGRNDSAPADWLSSCSPPARSRPAPTPRWRTRRSRADRASVRALLERRVDVNQAQADGMTALHWAAYHDDLETAKLLVDAGADVEGREPLRRDAPLAGLHERQRGDGRAVARGRRRPERDAPRRRDGLDDRRAHREARAREGAARPRGRRQRQGTARADGPDVGGGRGSCGGRRGAARGGGRFPHPAALRVHAPVLRRARRPDGRRPGPAEGGGRRERGHAAQEVVRARPPPGDQPR